MKLKADSELQQTGHFNPQSKEDIADLMDITRIMRYREHGNSIKKVIKIATKETSMTKERIESILRHIARNS